MTAQPMDLLTLQLIAIASAEPKLRPDEMDEVVVDELLIIISRYRLGLSRWAHTATYAGVKTSARA